MRVCELAALLEDQDPAALVLVEGRGGEDFWGVAELVPGDEPSVAVFLRPGPLVPVLVEG